MAKEVRNGTTAGKKQQPPTAAAAATAAVVQHQAVHWHMELHQYICPICCAHSSVMVMVRPKMCSFEHQLLRGSSCTVLQSCAQQLLDPCM
jgi:hypothetical protein